MTINYACEDFSAIAAAVERERGVAAGMAGADAKPPDDCKHPMAWRAGWEIGRAGRTSE